MGERELERLTMSNEENGEGLDYRVYRKVLLMVGELHARGYQRLRIAPGMAPSGFYWRCSITPVTNISSIHGALIAFKSDHDQLIARYSSADEGRYFGWKYVSRSKPSKLADLFIGHFPNIVEAGLGPDWEYAGWYQWMLHLTAPDAFPVAYADYDLPEDYLTTEGGHNDIKIPLPPAGLAHEE